MSDCVPVIFGEVLFDIFPDGTRVLGGAPFNVAWNLQAFDVAPVLVSRVGSDPAGETIRQRMTDWGMSTIGLQTDSRHATGEVRVSLADGEPSYDIVTERAWDHIATDRMPPLKPALIYHGTLGLRHQASAASFEHLQQTCPDRVFLDVNLRPPFWHQKDCERLMSRATWVKLNEDELAGLAPGSGSVTERAKRLREHHGLRLLVVTQGARGAMAIDDEGNSHHVEPTSSVDVVDTVGAGDAFASVLILGIMRDWPIDATLARAQQFASMMVGNRGAVMDDRQRFQDLRDTWDGDRAH